MILKKIMISSFFVIRLFSLPIMQNHSVSILPTHQEIFKRLPNQAVIQGMLQQQHPCTVFVDDNKLGHYTLVKSGGIFAFLAGTPSPDELHTIVDWLRTYPTIMLICDESLHSLFIQQGLLLQHRTELVFPDTQRNLTVNDCPPGYSIKLIDNAELLKNCLWGQVVMNWYGGATAFLDHGFGYVLLTDTGEIAAECHAAFIGDGLCEIGIITNPAHQKKGYATLVLQPVLQECFRRNLEPRWSCHADNIGSLKTALKNGFVINRYYAFIKWIKN